MKHSLLHTAALGLLLGSTSLISGAWAADMPGTTTTSQTTKTTTDASGATTTRTDWSREDNYWRDNYTKQSYYRQGQTYQYYEPAYHYGVTVYDQYNGRPFEQLSDAELRAGWEKMYPNTTITWTEARPIVRDSYTRIYQTSPAAGKVTTTKTTTTYSQ